MRDQFNQLVSALVKGLRANEVLLASFAGETSDFVRFNQGRVRQPGTVHQAAVTLQLIDGKRHATTELNLTGAGADDLTRARGALTGLRDLLPHLPEDPHLLYCTAPATSAHVDKSQLAAREEITEHILEPAQDLDLVGFYAGGPVYRGFASSLGHDHWFQRHSFTFDWSLYRSGDKAVKQSYAGFAWDPAAYGAKLQQGRDQLERLGQSPKTITPGTYRVYFAPAAMREVMGLLAWVGFGARALRTKQSPLVKMQDAGARLHQSFTLVENTAESTGPQFQEAGFLKPSRVTLIQEGQLADPLVSPRSAVEYGLPTNGASGAEMPSALELAAGELPQAEVLTRLGTGLYVNNLWYGNFSDRPAGRITAMTRFACFWVEDAQLGAPLNVMRFDESIFHLFGRGLEGLTQERDLELDNDTYQLV